MNHNRAVFRQRMRRRWRVRNHIKAVSERPRLSIFRSHKHTYVQIIDDASGRTLAAASTNEKSAPVAVDYGGNCDAAVAVGKLIAERAIAAGIKEVAFDRREYKYHGRIAALAEAARAAGLSL